MTKSVFIDESAFVALNSPISPFHDTAVEYVKSFLGDTVRVMTNDVVVALAAGELKQKGGAELARRFLELLTDGGIVRLPVSREVFEKAEWLFSQTEHLVDVTYVDCLNIACMEHFQITKIFSFKDYLRSMNVLVVPKK
jgi:predicted nucleic acid-binding protein